MLAQLLADTAEQFPDKTGLVYDGERWTWGELQDRVAGLTAGLARAGIGPDDEVGIWLPNSPGFILSYFAILACGAVAVTCNPALKQGDCPPRIKGLRTMITSRHLEAGCRSAMEGGAPGRRPRVLVCPDPDRCLEWSLFDEVRAVRVQREAGSPAMLQFSSGTTGLPKPLYRTHGQCLAEVRQFRETCRMTERDVIFGALPLFHAHGMANSMWAAVGSGATLVLMKDPQPFGLQWGRALHALEEEGVTVFPGVPLLFRTLAEAPAEGVRLERMRLCFSAGDALPRAVFDRFFEKFGVPVRQLYGCTEAGAVTINLESDPHPSAESVGRPMRGVRVELRGDSGLTVAAGQVGEIVFSSAASTSRYDLESGENDRFQNGWFRSGDLGRLDGEGRLQIVGRKAFVLTVAGHKVNASEIEEVLRRHPMVAEAAVVGMPDERLGERMQAYVVGRGGLAAGELIEHCKTQLPDFKRPQEFVFRDQLPKTALGKVAKDQLCE